MRAKRMCRFASMVLTLPPPLFSALLKWTRNSRRSGRIVIIMQSLGSRLATIVAGRAVLPASRRLASRNSAPPKSWLNAGASAAAAPAGSKGLNRSVSTFEARQAVMARRTGVSISLARRSRNDVKGPKTTNKAAAKPRKAHKRWDASPRIVVVVLLLLLLLVPSLTSASIRGQRVQHRRISMQGGAEREVVRVGNRDGFERGGGG
jgi:hypothetical protein